MRTLRKTLACIVMCSFFIFNACKKATPDVTVDPGPPASTGNAAVDALLAINPPDAFNYRTEKELTLDITIWAPDDTPIKNIPIRILNKAPELGGTVLFKALTDENGKITGNIKLPAYFDQVVVDPQYLGIMRNAVVNIQGGGIWCKIGGRSGYGGNIVNNSNLGGRPVSGVGHKPMGVSYSYLGSYDNQGKPAYLEPQNQAISASFLADINASLPERQPVMTYHPDYIANNVETNLNITALSDVWLTFVAEGAGYRNSIAYFTYPTGNPPQTASEIDSLHIILPNASMVGSSGSLVSGNTVKIGRFSPGTSVGFALIADGWNGSVVGAGNWIVYSLDQLNPQSNAALKRQSVLLYDNVQKLFLVGFEDIRRDNGGCDNDFNDCIFYLKSNPVTGISTVNVNPIDKPVDSDHDGVNDVYDDFPNDASRAYINYYPAINTTGTLAFEDNWPFLGDYDVNDLVVGYRYAVISNALNNVISVNAKYTIDASGASFKNGFGVQFPFAASLVQSVTGGAGSGDVVTMSANGCEAGQAKAVIIPFVDAFAHMNVASGFINTISGSHAIYGDTVSMNLTFTRPLSQSEMGTAPYNPFIIINKTRGREAHLPGYVPTDKIDTRYFGTGADKTKPSTGKYYKTSTNLPWGLGFSEKFDYPIETKAINTAFTNFVPWVQSGGLTNTNWYKDSANMVRSNIYRR